MVRPKAVKQWKKRKRACGLVGWLAGWLVGWLVGWSMDGWMDRWREGKLEVGGRGREESTERKESDKQYEEDTK